LADCLGLYFFTPGSFQGTGYPATHPQSVIGSIHHGINFKLGNIPVVDFNLNHGLPLGHLTRFRV
jgi:hypothetical protein